MALSNGPNGPGIRDGQSLAEASATLFKDILLGGPGGGGAVQGGAPSNRRRRPPFQSSGGVRPASSSGGYPLSLPPSLRFEDIQFLRSESNGGLRRNSSLHSLWTAWDEAVSSPSGGVNSKRVISGVPGLGISVSSVKNNGGKKKFSSARLPPPESLRPRHKVTFNLPDEPCCCCCSCCSCCSSSYSPLSCCGPLLPPDLPPKVVLSHEADNGGSGDQHYSSPAPRDGDYSYAYDSSVSPAFLIKWREERGGSEGGGGSPSLGGRRENLYEEIVDVHEQIKKFSVANNGGGGHRGSPQAESNSDSGIGNLVCSSGTLDMKKSLVQRANSFSSRDVYIPSRRVSIHPPTCNNHKCCATSRALGPRAAAHPRRPEEESPPSSTGEAPHLSSEKRPLSAPAHTPPPASSPKIKGLFKRVLNKWSHC